MVKTVIPPNTGNPTDTQRHEALLNSLVKAGRPEDFSYIVRLFSPPPDITYYSPPGAFKGKRVGIAGGGLAGMSAAFELRKLGFDITIFEASPDRIGGKVYTHYFDEGKTLYGELGATRIPISHESTWHYINLFKLNTIPFIQASKNSFTYIMGTRVRNESSGKNIMEQVYPKFGLMPAEKKTPWPGLFRNTIDTALSGMSPPVRAQLLSILPHYSPGIQYLINSSGRQVLEDSGLSEEAINLISRAIPLYGQFLYNSYSEMLEDEYSMAFARLYEIEGGMVNLPLAFYKSLASPSPSEYTGIPKDALGTVKWMGDAPVTGIYRQGAFGKFMLRYRNGRHGDENYDTFDYIVLAIPYSILRGFEFDPLFSNRKMQAIKEVNYTNAQKTLFLCRDRFWERGGESERIIGGASYTDMIIQIIMYPSRPGLCPEGVSECKGVLVASYNLYQDAVRLGSMEEGERIKLIKRQVEQVQNLPRGYLDDMVLDYKTIEWDRENWALGAFALYNPEQKRIFSYEMIKPEYDDHVFFAGEHVSPTHAFIQGALYSGMLAANSLAYHAVRR